MYRGHKIWFDTRSSCWRYVDSGQSVEDSPERCCGLCKQLRTPEGHDPCLGTLPGVMNACCGHGETSSAYVQFPDGSDIRGDEALEYFERAKQCQS